MPLLAQPRVCFGDQASPTWKQPRGKDATIAPPPRKRSRRGNTRSTSYLKPQHHRDVLLLSPAPLETSQNRFPPSRQPSSRLRLLHQAVAEASRNPPGFDRCFAARGPRWRLAALVPEVAVAARQGDRETSAHGLARARSIIPSQDHCGVVMMRSSDAMSDARRPRPGFW
jgi:hypothetical protein